MNLDLSSGEMAFRDEVRAWLAEHVPAEPLPSMDTTEGFEAHRAWEATLAGARLSVVSWPRDFGGREASLVEWVIFEEEYYRAGAPGRVSQNGIFLLSPILFEHGTAEQQQRYLPSMATGERIWAQCWSEPGAGSDLAALRSTATRVSASPTSGQSGWLLNGQKTWSSRATYAHMGFGLFRSDTSAERHRGLTYFLFPLDAPGVTVRPIEQLDGEPGFAEVFFDDVFVPDSDVLGAVGDGWRVAMSTAGNERGLSLRSPGRFCAAADRLVALYARAAGLDTPPLVPRDGYSTNETVGLDTPPLVPRDGYSTNDDAGARVSRPPDGVGDRVADAWIRAQAYRLYTWGTVTRLASGADVGAAGSVNKVFWSELDIDLHETALELLDAESELVSTWTDGHLFALAGPIYAGTNEIQRNIVAERILGLPKEARG